MSGELSLSHISRRSTGWLGIAGGVLLYGVLFAVNYWLPIGSSSYTSRIWNWTQAILTLGACLTLIVCRRSLTTRLVLLGLGLTLLNALSYQLSDPALLWQVQEGIAVWTCFLAGSILVKESVISIPAFQPPLAKIGTSIGLGILLAVPLAVVNNLYFYRNVGTIQQQNIFFSALEALRPAIHEEIVYRFFVLAVVLYLLRSSASPRRALIVAASLAVVPHSLNHLPGLFLESPAMGLFLLTATSLLFGLPMAILQIRKNLETAIAFHWFIDFARFLFGY